MGGEKCNFGQSKEDQEDWLLVQAGLDHETGGYDHTTLSGDFMQLIEQNCGFWYSHNHTITLTSVVYANYYWSYKSCTNESNWQTGLKRFRGGCTSTSLNQVKIKHNDDEMMIKQNSCAIHGINVKNTLMVNAYNIWWVAWIPGGYAYHNLYKPGAAC